jgi:hypothetical protein
LGFHGVIGLPFVRVRRIAVDAGRPAVPMAPFVAMTLVLLLVIVVVLAVLRRMLLRRSLAALLLLPRSAAAALAQPAANFFATGRATLRLGESFFFEEDLLARVENETLTAIFAIQQFIAGL